MRVLIILLVFASSLSAQNGFLTTLVNIQQGRGRDLIVDDDSNIVVVGWSANGNNLDVQMVKTDLQGSTIWERQFGSVHIDRAFSIIQGSVGNDDNYYVFGVLGRPDTLFEGNSEGLVLKIDKDGNEVWRVSWQDEILNVAGEGFQDENGDLILLGYTKPFANSSTTSMVVSKISQAGALLWRKLYGDFFSPSDFLAQPDGEQYYASGIYEFSSMTKFPFIAAFDKNGDTLWSKVNYDRFGDYTYNSVLLNAPKNRLYLVTSFTKPNNDTIFPSIALLDTTGEIIWKKDFTPAKERGFFTSDACHGPEGSILIFGDRVFSPGERSVWIGKYVPGEDTLCSQTFPGQFESYAAAGVCLNNDYVLATGVLNNEMVLLKEKVCPAPPTPGSLNQIFPNPTASFLNIDLEIPSSNEVGLMVYNCLGQLVMEARSVPVVDNRLVHTIDFSRVRPGIYFLKIVESDNSQVHRVIKY